MSEHTREGAAGHPANTAVICPVVAVALALDELNHMKAMECLPEPEALLMRLQARTVDFNMLTGVCAAYLRTGVSE